MNLRRFRGRPLPLGASLTGHSVNFALLSKHATEVTLVLQVLDSGPPEEIELHPQRNRTGEHWHIRLEGLPDQFRYGWRVGGRSGPRDRFDKAIVLLDPAAPLISDGGGWGTTCET